mmetsp:Transcript_84840/g.235256  ORF Transcript_84840/g.235256 Transcript_84840/m.235256 type:complete len:417 (+) Transcript_84840:168-1418(+)
MAAAPALVHPEPPFPAHVLTCAGGSAPQALGVVPPPDYDWEMDRGSQHSVSCVSLGCSCAVAACLSYLKLRDAAYPFDWNRTTIEGVIHFLRTGFADFLQFAWVQAFPGGKATGGNSYHGAHHSIWHEDMGTADGPSKYQRRIRRFFHNTASRLLFIRILNSSTELANARHLLQILQVLFSRSEVYLLLIVVCQLAVRSFVVDGTRGRLLVHWIVQWPHDVLVYKDAILFGHRQASAAEGHLPDPSVRIARSCEDMLSLLIPFFGGPPQQVPFCPRPLVPLLLPGQAGPQELLPCAPAQDPAALTQTAAVLQLAGAMPMQYPVAGAVWKAAPPPPPPPAAPAEGAMTAVASGCTPAAESAPAVEAAAPAHTAEGVSWEALPVASTLCEVATAPALALPAVGASWEVGLLAAPAVHT